MNTPQANDKQRKPVRSRDLLVEKALEGLGRSWKVPLYCGLSEIRPLQLPNGAAAVQFYLVRVVEMKETNVSRAFYVMLH